MIAWSTTIRQKLHVFVQESISIYKHSPDSTKRLKKKKLSISIPTKRFFQAEKSNISLEVVKLYEENKTKTIDDDDFIEFQDMMIRSRLHNMKIDEKK